MNLCPRCGQRPIQNKKRQLCKACGETMAQREQPIVTPSYDYRSLLTPRTRKALEDRERLTNGKPPTVVTLTVITGGAEDK